MVLPLTDGISKQTLEDRVPRERWVGRVYGRLVEDAVSASAVELVEPGPRAVWRDHLNV